ncbi:hypothetical protein U1Q18_037279, partial [Sarracenia purpurea var. burkii]
MEQKLLQWLPTCKSINELKQTHVRILVNGLQHSIYIVPKLIALASDLISLDYAINVFRSSHSPNAIAFNNMIKCFIGKSHRGALRMYKQMRELLISPNSFTFTFLLRCFESVEALDEGLLKAGSMELAGSVFERMPERNEVSWNSMISGYIRVGDIHGNGTLLEFVTKKILDQEPSNPSYLTLITNLSSSVGRWEDALNFRVAMRHE